MNLILSPIWVPLFFAIVSILCWRSRRMQTGLALVGTSTLLVISFLILQRVWAEGTQVAQLGSWPAPFGITVVADLLAAIMVVLTGLMGLAVTVYSIATIDRERVSFGYYPLLQVLLMGVCGAFLTGDIFNLYVWFEVLLIASFILLALGGERAQMEGAIKYVTLNLLSSALFLTAVGLLYGATGTLNLADLSVALSRDVSKGLSLSLAMLFLIAFGIKAAVFPLFFWLPASYHTPPVAVSAIFAGLLTKVGVYALIRVFTLLFLQNVNYTHTILLIVSGLTMLTGVLGAAAQNQWRRILSFHIISQIGYMLMGLALYSPLALAGSIFYLLHHIIVKTNLFLVSGIAERVMGSGELKKMGGLFRLYPWLGLLFLIPALSLAGIPPLSGFFAKFILIKAGLQEGQYAIVLTALAVGLLTLFSMTKIWSEAFWKETPSAGNPQLVSIPRTMVLPILTLALLTLAIGFGAEGVFNLSKRAADELLSPHRYIEAVLGSRAIRMESL